MSNYKHSQDEELNAYINKEYLVKGILVLLSILFLAGILSTYGCSNKTAATRSLPTNKTENPPAVNASVSIASNKKSATVPSTSAAPPAQTVQTVAPSPGNPVVSSDPGMVAKQGISKITLHPTNLKGYPLVINGAKISTIDFKRKLFKAKFVQSAQGLDYSGPNSNELYGKLKTHVLQELIRETVIDQQAAENGVSIPDTQVEEVMAGIKSRFPTHEAFITTMKSRGLTEETMKAYNKLQLVSVALLNKLGSQVQFDELINSKISAANIEIDTSLVDKLTFEIMQEHQAPSVN